MRDDWILDSMQAFLKMTDEEDPAIQIKNYRTHTELGKVLKGESLFSEEVSPREQNEPVAIEDAHQFGLGAVFGEVTIPENILTTKGETNDVLVGSDINDPFFNVPIDVMNENNRLRKVSPGNNDTDS